jgi:hypothetical protein
MFDQQLQACIPSSPVQISNLLQPALLASAALTFFAACSGSDEAPIGTTPANGTGNSPSACDDRPANLLANPSFENGAEPWITLAPESGFEVSPEQANCGAASAVLRMRDPATAEGSKVYYLVQEINPEDFPEVVRGSYRVENWNHGTVRQYLQFVIIAIGPKNFEGLSQQHPNYQIRYPLAGIQSPPFPIGNAFFEFLGRDEPVQGQWVPFEANIRADFERLWKRVPADYEKLRLLFEVRWDAKTPGDGAPNGDIYYDDLYAGPAN